MHRLKLTKSTSMPNQYGITLIESLVAIVVAALGILGILGVQMRTLTDTQTTVRRAQAIRLIEDFGERLRANPNGLGNINNYTSGWTATPPTPAAAKDCGTTACNNAELAAYDLAEWTRGVQRNLPLGDASVFIAKGETDVTNLRQLGVMISWRENERVPPEDAASNTYRLPISASTDGGDVACPADRTCHLQYIPVPARCAPYFGGSAVQYYCSGS